MTSFAFIAGLVPLVIATGAVLYVVFQRLRDMIKGSPKPEVRAVQAATDAPEVAPL